MAILVTEVLTDAPLVSHLPKEDLDEASLIAKVNELAKSIKDYAAEHSIHPWFTKIEEGRAFLTTIQGKLQDYEIQVDALRQRSSPGGQLETLQETASLIQRAQEATKYLIGPLVAVQWNLGLCEHGSDALPEKTSDFVEGVLAGAIVSESEKLLGEGCFGSVRELKLGEGVYAVKTPGSLTDKRLHQREGYMLMMLRHPNIVRLMAFTLDHAYLELGKTDVRSLVKRREQFDIRQCTADVVKALMYIHGKGITHKDVKSANVLIFDENIFKLCDFGFSARTEGDSRVSGTPLYSAPEIIAKQGPFSSAVDRWSLGVLVVELVTEGIFPFSNTKDILAHRGPLSPTFFNKLPASEQVNMTRLDPHKTLRRVALALIHEDPKQRFSLKDIDCHLSKKL